MFLYDHETNELVAKVFDCIATVSPSAESVRFYCTVCLSPASTALHSSFCSENMGTTTTTTTTTARRRMRCVARFIFAQLPSSQSRFHRLEGSCVQHQPPEIRFSASAGIAGHVFTTGTILNIRDAYAHPLFYKGVDLETGFITKCGPSPAGHTRAAALPTFSCSRFTARRCRLRLPNDLREAIEMCRRN